jgi:hypothetical protein
MKKKIYLSIIYTFTLVCTCVGLLGNVLNLSPFNRITSVSLGKHTTLSEEYSNVDAIRLNAELCFVTITRGSTLRVEFEGMERLIPTMENDNGILTISQNARTLSLNAQKTDCRITVTIPDDTSLDSINTQINVGSLTIQDITTDTLHAEIDVGSLALSGLNTSICKANVDIGDIKIDDCNSDSFSLSVDMGDIRLNGIDTQEYNTSLTVDLGNIKIDGNTTANNYATAQDKDKTLDAEVSLGDIRISKQ